MSLLSDAITYVEREWACVPASGKKAAGPWSQYIAVPPTAEDLRDMLQRPGVTGVGLIPRDDFGVLDFDNHAARDAWADDHPTLARELPCVETPRGQHFYCRSDLHRTVRLSGGAGEYRAGAALVIAPGSMHPSGGRYRWIRPLPVGELKMVPHVELIGRNVTESADCCSSAFSALSVLSVTTEDLLQQTQPQQHGERMRRLFTLARGAKFNLKITDTDELRALVRRWHALALPNIATKDFTTTWSDFLQAYDHAKHPLGYSAVDVAAKQVDPDDLPPAAMQYDDDLTRRLVSLCAALGQQNGGRFFLSSHDAAERLVATPMQVWRLLKMLIRDDVLEQVTAGNERRATRYGWIGGPNHE